MWITLARPRTSWRIARKRARRSFSLIPRSLRPKGERSKAAMTATARAGVIPRAVTAGMPASPSPRMAITTVPPANTTAWPAVASARPAARPSRKAVSGAAGRAKTAAWRAGGRPAATPPVARSGVSRLSSGVKRPGRVYPCAAAPAGAAPAGPGGVRRVVAPHAPTPGGVARGGPPGGRRAAPGPGGGADTGGGGRVGPLRGRLAARHTRRDVAGAGEAELALRCEMSDKAGGETLVRLREHALVEGGEDFGGVGGVAGDGVDGSDEEGDHHGSGNTFSGDVADDEDETAVAVGELLGEVAADDVRGGVDGLDREAGDGRGGFRDEHPLDVAGGGELVVEVLFASACVGEAADEEDKHGHDKDDGENRGESDPEGKDGDVEAGVPAR